MKKLFLIAICALLLCGCATAKLKDGKDSIVTFNEGGLSAEDLYELLKEKYGYKELINLRDSAFLITLVDTGLRVHEIWNQ